MRFLIPCAAIVLIALAAPPIAAQEVPTKLARVKDVPTKVEYYYRVKWGSLKDFIRLYEKNHQPLLEEMRKAGFVLSMKTEFPFTHLSGGTRWDMRVTITYRDAAAAINDPAWEKSWAEAKQRMFRDASALDAEEKTRFSLLEEHWDVVVSDFPE